MGKRAHPIYAMAGAGDISWGWRKSAPYLAIKQAIS